MHDNLSSEDEMASGIMTPPKAGESIIKNEKSIHTELEQHLKKLKLDQEL